MLCFFCFLSVKEKKNVKGKEKKERKAFHWIKRIMNVCGGWEERGNNSCKYVQFYTSEVRKE